MAITSIYKDAIRILFILVKGSIPYTGLDSDESGPVSIFKSESRLHAFDFWMRNPDYLAEELLDRYQKEKVVDDLKIAQQIFLDEEPELRKFPMIRYRFGAYEKIDNTMSILRSRSLVSIDRIVDHGVLRETDFLINQSAIDFTNSIVSEWEPLEWYSKRAELVADVAGDRGGAELKRRQYEQLEYADTVLGERIPSIIQRVKGRLQELTMNGGS